jgi:hypothetical protein
LGRRRYLEFHVTGIGPCDERWSAGQTPESGEEVGAMNTAEIACRTRVVSLHDADAPMLIPAAFHHRPCALGRW